MLYRERSRAPLSSKSAAQRWGVEREREWFNELTRPQPELRSQKEAPTLAEFGPRFVLQVLASVDGGRDARLPLPRLPGDSRQGAAGLLGTGLRLHGLLALDDERRAKNVENLPKSRQ